MNTYYLTHPFQASAQTRARSGKRDRFFPVNPLGNLRILGSTRRFARDKCERLNPLANEKKSRCIRLRFREQDRLDSCIIQRSKEAIPLKYHRAEFKPAYTVDLSMKFETFEENSDRMRERFRVPGPHHAGWT